MYYIMIVAPNGAVSYGYYGLPIEDFYEACSRCDETAAENHGCECFVIDESGHRLTM